MKQYIKASYISRPQECLAFNRDWFIRDQIEHTKDALLYEIKREIKIDIIENIHGKEIIASLVIPEQIKVVKPEINYDSFFIDAQLSKDLQESENINKRLKYKLSLLSLFLIMCVIGLLLMFVFILLLVFVMEFNNASLF